jgi:hypothetical protein
MPGGGRKGGGRGGSAKRAGAQGSAKMMNAWLTTTKKSGSVAENDGELMEGVEEARLEEKEVNEEVKRGKRRSRSPKKTETAAPLAVLEGESTMDGIKTMEEEEVIEGLEEKIERLQAKAGEEVEANPNVANRTRFAVYKHIATPIDADTAAYAINTITPIHFSTIYQPILYQIRRLTRSGDFPLFFFFIPFIPFFFHFSLSLHIIFIYSMMVKYDLGNTEEEDALLQEVLGKHKSSTVAKKPSSRHSKLTGSKATASIGPSSKKKKMTQLDIYEEVTSTVRNGVEKRASAEASSTSHVPSLKKDQSQMDGVKEMEGNVDELRGVESNMKGREEEEKKSTEGDFHQPILTSEPSEVISTMVTRVPMRSTQQVRSVRGGGGGGDVMDAILAKQEEDERISLKLASLLEQISSSGSGDGEAAASSSPSSSQNNANSNSPSSSSSGGPFGHGHQPSQKKTHRVKSLESHEVDDFHHETSYLVKFFTLTQRHKLASQISQSASYIDYYQHGTPLPSKNIGIGASGSMEEDLVQREIKSPITIDCSDVGLSPHQETMINKLCDDVNGILKLGVLKQYLKRIPCPKYIAMWLLHILCCSSHRETAFEAYEMLLSMLPSPEGGWGARITKNGNLFSETCAASPTMNSKKRMSPLVWDFELMTRVWTMFGAGAEGKLIEKKKLEEEIEADRAANLGDFDTHGRNKDYTMLEGLGVANEKKENNKLLSSSSLRKAVHTANFMERVESHANRVSDEVIAASLAVDDEAFSKHLSNPNFLPYNFSLLSLLISASSISPKHLSLSPQEMIKTIVMVYRAMVDPSCQSIISDLQVLLINLYHHFLQSKTNQEEISSVVYRVCEEMWVQFRSEDLEEGAESVEVGGNVGVGSVPPPSSSSSSSLRHPSNSRNKFHATFFRWAYLTPCCDLLMRTIRSSVAFFFLCRQASPLSPPPQPIPTPPSYSSPSPYTPGNHFFSLQHLNDFLSSTKFPKNVSAAEWAMYSDWVLLIDIASACFDVADLVNHKRALTQWDHAFAKFHKQAKEKGNYDLSMARFKDLATHSFTKLRIINNSVQRPDPMATFKAAATTKP